MPILVAGDSVATGAPVASNTNYAPPILRHAARLRAANTGRSDRRSGQLSDQAGRGSKSECARFARASFVVAARSRGEHTAADIPIATQTTCHPRSWGLRQQVGISNGHLCVARVKRGSICDQRQITADPPTSASLYSGPQGSTFSPQSLAHHIIREGRTGIYRAGVRDQGTRPLGRTDRQGVQRIRAAGDSTMRLWPSDCVGPRIKLPAVLQPWVASTGQRHPCPVSDLLSMGSNMRPPSVCLANNTAAPRLAVCAVCDG